MAREEKKREFWRAYSSDLGDCSRAPAEVPSATSLLPCFHTANPSPKKGPISTTKKANKKSTRNSRTITIAGIGFLAPTLEPSPPRRISNPAHTRLVRCYEEHRRVQKVTATLTFFRCALSPVFAHRSIRFFRFVPAATVWDARDFRRLKIPAPELACASQHPQNQFLPTP